MGAVVDPQARVVGVENLRVVDAWIMPTIPHGNTNIPTLMLAQKCAAQVLSERRGCAQQAWAFQAGSGAGICRLQSLRAR